MKGMKGFFSSIILIGSLLIIASCSRQQQKDIALKMDQLELELNSIESSMRSALIKESTYNLADKLELKKDSITKAYEKLKLQLKNPWYKGRDFPYEQILNDLAEEGYNLSGYDNFVPVSTDTYKRVLLILLGINWNMEDATKIKNIIMRTLPYEPELGKYSDWTWTASKYDIEMFESGMHQINIRFLTK